MLEEPDEVMELFEYMNKFYMEVSAKAMEYYKPDVWCITDDTATATNPFISVEMYREMVKPFHTREASFAKNIGMPIDMHDCGRCEDFIEDWLDFGVTCWNPAQVMNDLKGIKEKYGNRLVLEGCWDSQAGRLAGRYRGNDPGAGAPVYRYFCPRRRFCVLGQSLWRSG